MKKTALLFTILLAIGVMATTACDPTSLSLDGTRQVKFTATSHVSPMTKTAYGAYTTDGKYQTISWKDGDKVRIWSPAGGSISGTPVPAVPSYVYADYTLKDASDDSQNHLSKARLNNADPNGLVWSGSDAAVFYAAYPGNIVEAGANTDGQLVFAFPLSATQSGTATGVKDMPLLSKQTVNNGQTVELNFYPAFNAIEFEMMGDPRFNPNNESFTVDWVELTKEEPTNRFDPLTGSLCYYDINGSAPRVTSVDGKGYSIKLENLNATVDNDHPAKFIFFTLPYDHTGLVLKVHSKKTGAVNGVTVTEESTRTLKLQQNGEWVKFPVGHKAVIKGMPYNPDGLWCFSTITLTGQVLNWVTDGNSIETTSSESPQASQFAVKGVTESTSARQTWILPTATTTATVSFKIMSPFGGTYAVTPVVDDLDNIDPDAFDVVFYDEAGDITTSTGTIGKTDDDGHKHPTKVTFTVTPKASAIGTSKKIAFNTTVTAPDGTVYNIDSETQLYDLRGYHYFMTQEP